MTHLQLFSARLFLGLAIIGLGAQVGYGQNAAARPDRGITPSGSYAVSDIENINLTSGNLNLSIPLASLPPMAGGKLGLTLRAVYNSKLWDVVRAERHSNPAYEETLFTYVVSNVQFADPIGGWSIGAGYSIRFESISDDYQMLTLPGDDPEYNDIGPYRWSKAILTTPDGATHELRPLDATPYGDPFLHHSYLRGYYKDDPDNANQSARYYSFDGSHLWVKIDPNPYDTQCQCRPHGVPLSWTLYLPDGTRVEQADGIQRIIDTNGNKIKIFNSDVNGVWTGHIQDELTGREITSTYDANANNGNGQSQIHYQTVGGTWETIYINWGTTTVLNKAYVFGDSYCSQAAIEFSQALPVVRSIVFPQTDPNEPNDNRRKFSFAYNSDTTDTVSQPWVPDCFNGEQTITSTSHGLGSLSQMTMPSGAQVNYGYRLDGNSLFDDPNELARDGVSSKQLVHDGTSESWTYDISSASNTSHFNGPDGSSVTETRYSSDPAFRYSNASFQGKEGLTYRTNQSNKILTERHWRLMNFGGANIAPGPALVTFNPVVDAEYTTLLDDTSSHNPIKMSAKTYSYDYNGNLLTETDYDWFDPSALACSGCRDAEGVPTGVPGSAVALRTVTNTYYNDSTSPTSTNVYARRSLSNATPLILNALEQSSLGSAVTQLSYDYNSYGVAPTIGNLTSKRVYDDVDDKWITSSMTYDSFGNVVTSTDGRGKVTTIGYDPCSHAQPISITRNPDNGTGPQANYTAYDCYTGLITSTTDANNQTSTIDYTNILLSSVDPFGRPGITYSPAVTVNGNSQQHRVTTRYLDSARQVIVASDLYGGNDQLLKIRTTSDMLGRSVLTEQTEDGTNYTIFSTKAYDNVNRITYASSPMRSTTSPTDSWTRVTNDVLGRPIYVDTFGGSSQPPATDTTTVSGFSGRVSTVYDANFTTVTDQAGKVRRSLTNALGQLTRVDEPDDNGSLGSTSSPNQATSYTYNVLGNLVKVVQGSQTPRYFMYDSLSRLVRARNPEQTTRSSLALDDSFTGNSDWCVSYAYDDNGNLTSKTDPRGIATTYTYDSLNRVTLRDYSDSTPDVTYTYDTLSQNGKGRLTAVSSSGLSYAYAGYDATGKPSGATQTIGSQTYTLSYLYDLSGHVTKMTYPSGHEVDYNYDNAGRLADKDSNNLAFTGNLGYGGSLRTYSNSMTYAAGGQMTQERFGTWSQVYNRLTYNSRGQLTEIYAGSGTSGNSAFNRGKIVNDYGSTANNGNLQQQTVYIPNNETNSSPASRYQQYSYDYLNRLSQVNEYTGNTSLNWQQKFNYDRWGNRTIDYSNTSESMPRPQFAVDTATNRLGVPSNQSGTMHYDEAGNLDTDTYSAMAVTRLYDAENRMTKETQGSSYEAGVYAYDGDGHRVKRKVNGAEIWQVYGLGGELLAEYAENTAASSPQKEYGYRNGQLLITADAPVAVSGAPAALSASPSSYSTSSNVSLSWSAVSGASKYRIERKDATTTWTYIGTATGTAFSDTGASLGTAYLYRTCVANTAGFCTSGYTKPALGARFNFSTDPTIQVGVTTIQLAHVTELRTAVNAVRTLAGLSAFDWDTSVYPAPTSNGLVYASHIIQLRQKLDEALLALGIKISAYDDATLFGAPAGTIIKASHINQLRDRATSTRTRLMPVDVTASNSYSSDYAPSKAVDGDVNSKWGSGGGPTQWIQLDLGQQANVTQVRLLVDQIPNGHTTHQVYGGPSTDNLSLLGTFDGNTNFWQVLELNINTSNVRYVKVVTTDSPSWVSWAEIEVYGAGGIESPSIHWSIGDQLGTPRIILDQTGSLANVSRHDYLPFGEELFAGVGGRTPQQAYSASDELRQHFTQEERDAETGLDYFFARYYSSSQGRFAGLDSYNVNLERQQAGNQREAESLFMKFIGNPQRWNSFSYALNNPVKYVDPNGQEPQDSLELNFERDVKALQKHQISEDEFRARMNARGVGAIAGLALVAAAYGGWETLVAALTWAVANPEQSEQIALDLQMAASGSPGPGSPGVLTLTGATRLTVEEAASGTRFAAQVGEHFVESAHEGAELIGTSGRFADKSVDLMGVPAAYVGKNWGRGAKFFDSILHHVNKSVDYVAIDLSGATKSQINAIQKYVSTLTKEQQAKIVYVTPQ